MGQHLAVEAVPVVVEAVMAVMMTKAVLVARLMVEALGAIPNMRYVGLISYHAQQIKRAVFVVTL